jgi:hypothetical protein
VEFKKKNKKESYIWSQISLIESFIWKHKSHTIQMMTITHVYINLMFFYEFGKFYIISWCK